MSLQILLQSHLETLIKQRDHYVSRIEDVNKQIVDLKKEAKRNGVNISYDSKNP